ncbi:MAG: polyprenyl synthetase family protein [Oscillospiraceae bacterium]|nr:polyprenyl synthetase family protein [Oscillospiraceae bacterium]
MTENFKARFNAYLQQVNEALPGFLPHGDAEQKTVYDAMAYSLMAGGKRIRAIMTMAFCELCGGNPADAVPFAAAIEMIHAYSLIHDDLPCMDDDDMRRGKPSCHIAFGEANALLAGDGLLTLAFETILDSKNTGNLPAKRVLDAAAVLAHAAGANGMVGGQVIDLESEGKQIPYERLQVLDRLKTGALIRASAVMGCVVAGAGQDVIDRAERYAAAVGLAFQIVDDILDVTADQAALGKPIGSDAENEKTTYITLFGIEKSRQIVKELVEESNNAIRGSILDDPFLYDLAEMLAVREY